MKRSDVLAVLNASFAIGTAARCPARCDRVWYLDKLKADLRSCVIEPVPVLVLIADPTRPCGTAQQSVRSMYAIARTTNNWLLYDAISGEFALATGSDGEALTHLGFLSHDALAEWQG